MAQGDAMRDAVAAKVLGATSITLASDEEMAPLEEKTRRLIRRKFNDDSEAYQYFTEALDIA